MRKQKRSKEKEYLIYFIHSRSTFIRIVLVETLRILEIELSSSRLKKKKRIFGNKNGRLDTSGDFLPFLIDVESSVPYENCHNLDKN